MRKYKNNRNYHFTVKYQRNYLSYAILTPQIRSVVKNRHPSIVCPFDYLTSTHNATGVTLFSTHHHSHDIKLLDYAISLITHGEQYPVFFNARYTQITSSSSCTNYYTNNSTHSERIHTDGSSKSSCNF